MRGAADEPLGVRRMGSVQDHAALVQDLLGSAGEVALRAPYAGSGADLRGAKLGACEEEYIDHRSTIPPARLGGALLTGARLDAATTWPSGFDPSEACAPGAPAVSYPSGGTDPD